MRLVSSTSSPRARLWWLFALSLQTALSFAESGHEFDPLDARLVLSQSSIQDLVQDRNGYLWIATQFGLDRFDGYSLRPWRPEVAPGEDINDYVNLFVNDLLVARDGTIWVGAVRGLLRFNPETRQLRALDPRSGPPPRVTPDSMVETPSGELFLIAEGQPWRVAASGAPAPVPVESPGVDHARSALVLDRMGRLWLGGRDGLWRYHPSRQRFEPVLDRSVTGDNPRLGANAVAAGPGTAVSYASANGVFMVDPDADETVRRIEPVRHGMPDNRVDAVNVDPRGNLWLLLPEALARVAPSPVAAWQTYELDSPPGPGSTGARAERLQVEETMAGHIWLAGRFGVVSHIPPGDQFTLFEHDPLNPRSLPPTVSDVGYRIFLDRFGVLWVGGNLGGLARRPPQRDRFVHVRDIAPGPTARNIVRAILEQPLGSDRFVWVSNQNHGLSVWRYQGPRDYRHVHHYAPGDGDSAPARVRAMALDPKSGAVWLGGRARLFRAARPGAPLQRVRMTDGPEAEPRGPPEEFVALRFIAPDRLVAATLARLWHIDVSAPDGPRVLDSIRFSESGGRRLRAFTMAPIDSHRVLIGGIGGMEIIDLKQDRRQRLQPVAQARDEAGDPLFGMVYHIARDRAGTFWLGTREAGLVRLELDDDQNDGLQPTYENIAREKIFPDDTIYAVLPDARGWLWLTTNRGILRFRPESGALRQYTPDDGIQGWEFNHNVAHAGASGQYYVGGVNGWNVFQPERVRDLLQPPRVFLDAVTVNGRSMAVGTDGSRLRLSHDLNRVVIDYHALHFAAPERVRYAWRLKGHDTQWVDAGAARQARFEALPPGDYRFELRAANLDGVWSAPETLLRMRITAPPWATRWARLTLIMVALILLLLLIQSQRRQRRRLQRLIEQNTAELSEQKALVDRQARRLRQALEARTLLFANVSHEFRTPLTLIRASIDKLERGPDGRAAALGRRYINRLLRLVEQLLDLSRLRLAEPDTSARPWRLDSLVGQTAEAFRTVAEQRGIQLESDTRGAWNTRCPRDLIERILLNLIGNAIKFTPSGGRVRITIAPALEPEPGAFVDSIRHAGEAGDDERDDEKRADRSRLPAAGVMLEVSDTGPGIADEERERVFQRFYRTGEQSGGAGIGLALVYEAARASGGKVNVSSPPGEGARFQVWLPAERPPVRTPMKPVPIDPERQQLDLDDLRPGTDSEPKLTPPPPDTDLASSDARGEVLVVEDNADLRQYLVELLSPDWSVQTADGGDAGYTIAARCLPDLIISDLMMPAGDGFELLARLREDPDTCHIPVLFLTARQDSQTRLRAYALKADAFLSKPFDAEELRTRLEQMLSQRQRMQAWLRGRGETGGHASEPETVADQSVDKPDTPGSPVPLEAGPPDLSPRDRQLLERIDEWMWKNYSDPDIEVSDMAEALHLTSRTLQRKLKALEGRTPAARLRDFRLERARGLLRDTERSVTEISLACGFSSSQYFSRVFRQETGMAPSAWREHAEDRDNP